MASARPENKTKTKAAWHNTTIYLFGISVKVKSNLFTCVKQTPQRSSRWNIYGPHSQGTISSCTALLPSAMLLTSQPRDHRLRRKHVSLVHTWPQSQREPLQWHPPPGMEGEGECPKCRLLSGTSGHRLCPEGKVARCGLH